ncbi:MAG: hypothetical protein F4X03_06175 [Dehalococcoidia bacterium]|nr:hypothetical protein [Dehalococcoidia bacterium]MYD28484.1 hypothetical protein [Dehalococcoidia bacterium]
MKKNLISAIAGWKSAALLALVAMVAAVAFSGILTSTNSADAAGPGESADVGPVTTNAFTNPAGAGVVTFEVTGGTASGSFTNGEQSIVCSNGSPCDTRKDTDGTDIEASITVKINIDDDSPNGFILITATDAQSGTVSRLRVDVSTDDRIASMTAGAVVDSTADPQVAVPSPALDAGVTTTGQEIVATLLNSKKAGLSGKDVIIYTTLGVLNGCGGEDGRQACTEQTDANGQVVVTLLPTDREGVATVNFSSGDFSAKVEVVLYGDAATISAAADQSSIEIGGSTFIVVTVLDSGENPVAGHPVALRAQAAVGDDDGVVGPAGENIVDLLEDLTVARPNPPGADIPGCTTGTDSSGKCAIQVIAPKKGRDATPDDDTDDVTDPADATRGTHTVHVAGPGTGANDMAVEIQVGGPPASISTDAPERVDALSATEVTVTVVDDEGVLVGKVVTSVTQVEGDGAVIAGGGAGETSDGVAKFTYLSPSRSGTAVFRVTAGEGAGTISHNVVIDIGPAPVEEPEGPAPTWSEPLTSGTHNLVWNGEDGADPSAGSEGVSAIWRWDGSTWLGYFPNAADVPGGNNLGSLENGTAYFVVVD